MAITSAGDGNWGTAGTWVGGVIPASGDAVIVNHTVVLDGVYPAAGAGFGAITGTGTIELPVASSWGLKLNGDVTCTVKFAMTGGGRLDAAQTGFITVTPATDGGSGVLLTPATCTIQGAIKDHLRYLAASVGEWDASADVAAVGNVASITLDAVPVGWRDGDDIVVAPTGPAYAHWDVCQLDGTPTTNVVAVKNWCSAAEFAAAAYLTTKGTQLKPQWNHEGDAVRTIDTAGNSGAVRSGATLTFTTTAAHGYAVGTAVRIAGVSEIDLLPFNGVYGVLATPTTTTFTVSIGGANDDGAFNGTTGGGTCTPIARAEVVNLTRNIRIYSTDPTKRGYVSTGTTNAVVLDYVEMWSMTGPSGGTGSLRILTTTGSFSSTGFVTHDGGRHGYESAGLTSGTVALTYPIAWRQFGSGAYGFYITAWTKSGSGSFTIAMGLSGYSNLHGFNIADAGTTLPGCISVGNQGSGIVYGENGLAIAGALAGVTAHSNGVWGCNLAVGSSFVNDPDTSFVSITVWRNASGGIPGNNNNRLHLTSPVLFGATAGSPLVSGGFIMVTPIFLGDSVAAWDTTTTYPANAYSLDFPVDIIGGTLARKMGMRQARVTVVDAIWNNFLAPVWFSSYNPRLGELQIIRFNRTKDDHRLYHPYGYVLSTTSAGNLHTAGGTAWMFYPIGGVGVWYRVPDRTAFPYSCAAGQQVSLRMWVYCAAAYNGTAKPRIVALGGFVAGIPTDVVGSSHSGAQAWELLTVTVTPSERGNVPVVCEGQGTAGYWIVDDIHTVAV